jgi:hypothetical protein
MKKCELCKKEITNEGLYCLTCQLAISGGQEPLSEEEARRLTIETYYDQYLMRKAALDAHKAELEPDMLTCKAKIAEQLAALEETSLKMPDGGHVAIKQATIGAKYDAKQVDEAVMAASEKMRRYRSFLGQIDNPEDFDLMTTQEAMRAYRDLASKLLKMGDLLLGEIGFARTEPRQGKPYVAIRGGKRND